MHQMHFTHTQTRQHISSLILLYARLLLSYYSLSSLLLAIKVLSAYREMIRQGVEDPGQSFWTDVNVTGVDENSFDDVTPPVR